VSVLFLAGVPNPGTTLAMPTLQAEELFTRSWRFQATQVPGQNVNRYSSSHPDSLGIVLANSRTQKLLRKRAFDEQPCIRSIEADAGVHAVDQVAGWRGCP
jgi:hypothetical protein